MPGGRDPIRSPFIQIARLLLKPQHATKHDADTPIQYLSINTCIIYDCISHFHSSRDISSFCATLCKPKPVAG